VAVPLHPGQDLRIAVGDQLGDATRLFTTYADLPRAVHAGDRLLIDDGRIELKVARADADEIVATVVDGGMLGERKGLNIPGVALSLESLTEKDADDLRFGLRLGVDLVAMSFVRRADDLRMVRDLLQREGREDVPLIAKLERPEAVARLEEILDVSDAVMVARGDLGLEMPLETVPRVQKEITRAARARGIPVIVATQVFESMRTEPRPTRAEVSDAAHAVDDGVDAIMLAGETAVGLFPARAVKTLDAVIREAEAVRVPAVPPASNPAVEQHEQPLCESAVTLARLSGGPAAREISVGGPGLRRDGPWRRRAPAHAPAGRGATGRVERE
jgi:pyruvate kinase